MSGHFTLGERVPSTHWIGGWVGPRAGCCGKEKYLRTYRESNTGHQAYTLISTLTETL
jgi:hypothetical protein